MTPATLPGFLTKKEVEERFGRSHRTLTRDFSSAVRLKDEEILPHLKLHTEDGTVRQGTDVTLEEIQQWSNAGLSPTWFVDEEWAAVRYGVRSNPVREQASVKKEKSSTPQGDTSTSRVGANEIVHRLEQQIEDLQRDKEKLYQELNIKNEQIQQANERTRESNVLMRELQALLGDVQKRALLSQSTQPSSKNLPSATEVEFATHENAAESITVKPEKVTTKTRVRSEKGSHRPKTKSTPATLMPAASASSSPPKWYEMPTLEKLLRRRP